MLLYIARKIVGTRNDRVLKSLQPLIQKINELEPIYIKQTNEELARNTNLFKERIQRGESLETIQPEAFAVAREASKRILGMRHFDVQLIGGAILNKGMIAEMKTGEGKTLVATLAAYLNALNGKGVHVVTVNDYLAKRDSEWMGRLYNFLGLSVGCIYAGLPDQKKKESYLSDITYGQNNEFGFDYLRDNMKFSLNDMYQRSHAFAIVDEVDSILIDEARTPLIISGPAEDATETYFLVNAIVPKLQKETHFAIDLRSKSPALTDEGIAKVEELLKIENLYDPKNIEILHCVTNALKAHTVFEKDVDYVVKDGQIIIVDEFTGRLMAGRRWSNGLHQAVEAKEGLKIARENVTLATITFQNYFRMYEKLSGMTGTADTEAAEFKQIYNLEVVVIPTNQPMQRKDMGDAIYRSRREKYQAVANDIEELNKTGQPILVGTISIEQSEALSKTLSAKGIKHNVLNAKQHEREAEIVSQAGRLGSVTISTNMAGRGTDIMLGGNPEFLAQTETGTKDREDPNFIEALKKYIEICKAEKAKVIEAGGLCILGTERHESRRIDNQLRGRAGRQGDPGSSKFYVSMEDDLMLRFGGERLQRLMNMMKWEEGSALDGRMINRSIETAQKRVEAMHFESRKHVTEYDDVLNKQRQVIYNLRHKILQQEGVRDEILVIIDDLMEESVIEHCPENKRPMDWNLEEIGKRYAFLFNDRLTLPDGLELNPQTIFDTVRNEARNLYLKRAEEKDKKLQSLVELSKSGKYPIEFEHEVPNYSSIEHRTFLEALDYFWNAHLREMDDLRDSIGLRGYGQKNPLYEYQKEGFILFQHTLFELKQAVIRKLSYEDVMDAETLLAQIEAEQQRRADIEKQMKMVHEPILADSDSVNANDAHKSPEDQRAKIEAQKKARRKNR